MAILKIEYLLTGVAVGVCGRQGLRAVGTWEAQCKNVSCLCVGLR